MLPQSERLHHDEPRRQRGFTLVEVLVTLVVVTLIALITVPTLQRMRVKTCTTCPLRSRAAASSVT